MKKFQVVATDTMGEQKVMLETDSKASAQNKARKLKTEAYTDVIVQSADEATYEVETPKAETPKTPKTPKTKVQVPEYDEGMDIVLAIANREGTVGEEYVLFVRSQAPKVLGIKSTEFHKLFGTGHVNQGDVVLLSTEWSEEEEIEFLAHARKTKSVAGARKLIDKALAHHGLVSTRRGPRVPGQKWGKYNPAAATKSAA